MKQYFTILFLLSASFAMVQPKITRNENFPIGWKLIFRNIDPASLSTGKTGANQTWDFSSMTLLPDSTIELITDPAWTAGGKDFPDANMVEQYSDGSYVFVNKNDSENYMVGYMGNGVKINYPKNILFGKRPMTYPDSFSRTYTARYSIQGLNYLYSGGGHIQTIVDGYGTLKLPGATYGNVLRLKISQSQKDTTLPGGAIRSSTTISYVWFDETHYSALLKIDSTNSGSNISRSAAYLLQEAMAGIDPVKSLSTSVSATIKDNQLQIRSQLVQGAEYSVVLYNMLGQTIYSNRFIASGSPVETLHIPGQIKGVYILNMQGTDTKYQGIKIIAQ